MKNPVVSKITDELPHELICERLQVSPRSIRLARERGTFPASWFKEMRALCKERGTECPESAFNFKSPSSDASKGGSPATDSLPDKKRGDAPADIQGQGVV